MKKILSSTVTHLVFLFSIAFSNIAFSQDDIIKVNNDVVKGKVEEVGVSVIRYRSADNPDGPMYDMPKSDVYMIVYANGSHYVVNNQNSGDAGNTGNAGNTGSGDNTPAPDAPIKAAPPEMPVYEQPLCPVEGYLWTPGYWAYGFPGGYYWVPGVWVGAPVAGYLWTPGYWGYEGGYYGWHNGYWGEHIGFYGGVNYGYGYGGSGYYGGRWEGGSFRYNTAVSRVDVTVIHTTYVDNTVVHNTTVVNHASFNGEGGVKAQPNTAEASAMHEQHLKATTDQNTHVAAARNNKSQYASENKGKPAVTSMNQTGGKPYSAEGHTTETRSNSAPHNAQGEQHMQQTRSNEEPSTQQKRGTEENTQQRSNTNSSAQQQHGGTTQTQRNNTAKPAAKPAQAAKPAPANNRPVKR